MSVFNQKILRRKCNDRVQAPQFMYTAIYIYFFFNETENNSVTPSKLYNNANASLASQCKKANKSSYPRNHFNRFVHSYTFLSRHQRNASYVVQWLKQQQKGSSSHCMHQTTVLHQSQTCLSSELSLVRFSVCVYAFPRGQWGVWQIPHTSYYMGAFCLSPNCITAQHSPLSYSALQSWRKNKKVVGHLGLIEKKKKTQFIQVLRSSEDCTSTKQLCHTM